jgi:hypothetical protein
MRDIYNFGQNPTYDSSWGWDPDQYQLWFTIHRPDREIPLFQVFLLCCCSVMDHVSVNDAFESAARLDESTKWFYQLHYGPRAE